MASKSRKNEFERWVLRKAIKEWKNAGISCRKIAQISGFTKSSVINYVSDAIKEERKPKKLTTQQILSQPWSTWTCTSEKTDLPTSSTN
jgi:transposase